MVQKGRIVSIDAKGVLIDEYGKLLTPPSYWSFLPAGDAGITRKVSANSDFWRVQVKKGRRTISKGIWASTAVIEEAKQLVEEVRKTTTYINRLEGDKQRRQKKQNQYEIDFFNAVKLFLNFNAVHKRIEATIANEVTKHAIPVGSGTVARTTTIPLSQRASKAVIAWMRHKTTAYDNLKIPHIKGERRAVRRALAEQSTQLLNRYRSQAEIPANCPLFMAVKDYLHQPTI